MSRRFKLTLKIAAPIVAIAGVSLYLHSTKVAIFNPEGIIASKERSLIIIALLLSLVVVIPVFALTIAIVWKYREGNTKKKKYTPDWDHNPALETLWWGIPIAIIAVLAVITWNSSHSLDPYKPIASSKPAMTVQVISLDWKWLFIYPNQHIATVNLLEIPKDTPINFQITSDTVMNSFWIPQLGGQIYAMPGMETHLNLVANQYGSFQGSSANISGAGFAGMKFTAKSVSESDFNSWVASVQKSKNNLSLSSYNQLAKPSSYNSQLTYSMNSNEDLYENVIMKYMAPNDANGMEM